MRSIFLLILVYLWISPVEELRGQNFGKNKAAYREFNFKVKKTPHFEIYHYLENDSLVDDLALKSEKWYAGHQQIFQDTFKLKNPIIFYNTHADFQQTNTISGGIGVGTGGVTEALKNRVVMPVTELSAQTDHVLGHELVHAFQYNLMKSSDSIRITDMNNIPLWMTEGLAEYLSIGNVDPHTALWMRDAIVNDDFPTLKDLTYSNKYFPYRYGQAFWAFVGGVWGDTVLLPLYKETAKVGYKQAVINVLGLDQKAFSERWKTITADHYRSFFSDSIDRKPGREIIGKQNAGRINIAPALSPDGRFIIFSSEKNLFTFDLFLADAQTGEILKTLSSVTRSNHIDEFSFMESAGTWSPRGDRFAFVGFSKGKNKIIVLDVMKGKSVDEFFIPGVDYVSNPSWSPEGNRLAFTGLVNGQSDIYIYDIRSRQVENLTKDRYSDLQPAWSPDGDFIVFASDRAITPSRKGISINVLSIKDKTVKTLPVFEGAHNLNPVYSPEGNRIYFLSDRDGFRNLYSYSLTDAGALQMTDFMTGITGITLYSPALSVAGKTGEIAYVYYNRSRYSIFSGDPDEFLNRKVDKGSVSFGPATLPPLLRNHDLVMQNLGGKMTSGQDTVKITSHPYRPKFKLDYIGNAIGVSVVNSNAGTRAGMNGAVNMLFSDILGDHKLYTALLVNGEAKDIAAQVAYINSKKRLGWGAMLSHIPYRSGALLSGKDQINISEDSVITVDNLSLITQRTFEEQVSLFSNYVISQTQRLEFYGALSRYHFDIIRDNNYFLNGRRIGQKRENVDAPSGYTIGELGTAYVLDNSFFGIASPMVGRRFRADLSTTMGEINYSTLSIDKRHYHRWEPFTFAWRLIYINRFGSGTNDPRLFPLSYAYPTLTRGNALNTFTGSPDGEDNQLINQLFGNQLLVGNFEVRFPFTGPERLAWAKSGVFFSELAWFFDSGLAWDRSHSLSLEADPSDSSKRAPQFTTGVSLRINLFGQLIIEPFYAVPLQNRDFRTPMFGVNFWPGW